MCVRFYGFDFVEESDRKWKWKWKWKENERGGLRLNKKIQINIKCKFIKIKKSIKKMY